MTLPRLFAALVVTSSLNGGLAATATSAWVHFDQVKEGNRKLTYQTTPAGDRIMDFSSAGYAGGGVPLPEPKVKVTVKPGEKGDDSEAIQVAVDQVAALPLENGFRGAVLLAPGTFRCAKTISLVSNGIVLRGSGSGPGGTTIQMVGPKHVAFALGRGTGRGRERPNGTETAQAGLGPVLAEITDEYLP